MRIPGSRRLPLGGPWGQALLWLARRLRRAWGRLTPQERSHLARLLRDSRGRPGKLADAQRRELKRIVRKARGKGTSRRGRRRR